MKRGVLFMHLVLALVCTLAATPAFAQGQTGSIYGRVTDPSGAPVPGVTVTVTSPILLQPLAATTSETGTYQFPGLEVATYSVKFELASFRTLVQNDIHITVGFNAQINAQMLVSTVEETVQVTSEAPIVDTRMTGTKQSFTEEKLQTIPSARDPWVILQQTAGIAMDRENIGGNMSGQQSNYISRGANTTNNKWVLDGVDTTDMSATGASPSYYDFDAFQEMTITTGGADVTQQTAGVGINLVTKSGGDRFRGSGRFYETSDNVESNNITDDLRLRGATSGNPIQDIKDYGIEAGGPIKRGRAWIWGSFGKQNVNVGVINFYQPTSQCQAIKANPIGFSIDAVNACLNTDQTKLQTTNLKAEVQLFQGNKLTVFNNFAKKERNARNASDTTPIESTNVQSAVPSKFGKWGWTVGPNPTYKVGDQWVASDRLLFDVQWAHIGNNFVLDIHDPSLQNVQPYFIIAGGFDGRSTPDGGQQIFIRPVNSVNANMTYFAPGVMGGDHSFKVGGYWRDSWTSSHSHTPGDAVARFPTFAELNNPNDCAAVDAGCQMQLPRDGLSISDLANVSLYGQDTFTRGRLTLTAGIRYDRNHEQALAANVAANPLKPDWLPAVNFAGVDPGIVYNNLAPRVGFTYDLKGDGRTLVKANYGLYWGQVGNGTISGSINPVSRVSARYAWVDTNHDKFVQPGEIVGPITAVLTTITGNWDPKNPTLVGTTNQVDPNLKNDRVNEVIVGFEHQIGPRFATGVNYIYRYYDNLLWSDVRPSTGAAVGVNALIGVPTDGSGYSPVQFTPDPATCAAAQAARCPTVTYYTPNAVLPTARILSNLPFHRTFNGVELTATKRMSQHWLLDASFSYNSAIQHYEQGSFQDPTNVALRNGYQYDFLTSGSGLGNVYVNSKWLFKISGLYQLPFNFNVAAFYNARQGYPFEPYVLTPNRTLPGTNINAGAGQAQVLLDPVGDNRLPNFQNLDFHLERPIKFGTVRWIPSLDIFNVGNGNTIQALQRQQNDAAMVNGQLVSHANNISAVTAPRVVRFGIRVAW
jgi:hypothetical protein